MSNYKEKYLKYKEKYSKLKNQEKYSKLKNQVGSAPLYDLPPEPLSDILEVLSQIKLAETSTLYRDAFSRRYSGYTSNFAPDIIIINNNIICNNQLGCNKFITHYRIKDILNRNGITIPNDGINVIPILESILLKTIRTNNDSDAEFLVSIGVIIKTIHYNLFKGQRLNDVYIPSCVTYIGTLAFADNNLVTVKIPNSVIIISYGAFANNKLIEVILPDSLITIGILAFANNKLETVRIPPNVTVIDQDAFADNLLIDINIPDSVIDIGSYAFQRNKLKTISIGRNVLTIGKGAFYNNPINNVTIPDRFIEQFADLFDNPAGITFNLLS